MDSMMIRPAIMLIVIVPVSGWSWILGAGTDAVPLPAPKPVELPRWTGLAATIAIPEPRPETPPRPIFVAVEPPEAPPRPAVDLDTTLAAIVAP